MNIHCPHCRTRRTFVRDAVMDYWIMHCSGCCRTAMNEDGQFACEERLTNLTEEEQAWLVIQGSMRS